MLALHLSLLLESLLLDTPLKPLVFVDLIGPLQLFCWRVASLRFVYALLSLTVSM